MNENLLIMLTSPDVNPRALDMRRGLFLDSQQFLQPNFHFHGLLLMESYTPVWTDLILALIEYIHLGD